MEIFKLFACCVPVKGFKNHIICDLQRSEFISIPEALHEILTLHKNKGISEIKSHYDEENYSFIDEYFEYLVDNEYGFLCDSKGIKNFPDLNLKFESPEFINNAIIDIDKDSNHNYSKIFEELNDLRCKFIEIRSFDVLKINKLEFILQCTAGKIFRNIDLIIKHYQNIEEDIEKRQLFSRFPNIGIITLHSSLTEKGLFNNRLRGIEKVIGSCMDCGIIKVDGFTSNIATFTEAQHFNTCLNKKVSIDSKGNLKNCPAFKENYGNINNNDSIIEIVKSKEFTSWWSISKDQIHTCKDCEFRYICTDCRAFVDNIFDKPKKCNYNPYLGKWE